MKNLFQRTICGQGRIRTANAGLFKPTLYQLELPVHIKRWTRRESNSPHSPCKGVSPAIGTCGPIFGLHSYKAFAETNPARCRKTGILAFPNYKFVA